MQFVSNIVKLRRKLGFAPLVMVYMILFLLTVSFKH